MKKARIISAPNGNCTIVHREYIRDIVAEGSSPSVFTALGLPINPGMSSTFPWLSQIAPRFEKYHFKKLHFDYETEAPTALGGSVLLTVDYDASDAPPSSKVQAMAYKNAVRTPPWSEACHVSAGEDLSQQKQYFVRNSALAANSDIKLYDTGNLFICSQNIATGGATLGELYVDYEVTLITPHLVLPSTSAIDTIFIEGQTAQTAALPFGTTALLVSAVQPPLLNYDSVTGIFIFNRAIHFNINLNVVGTVLSNLVWSGSLGVGISTESIIVIDGGALNLNSVMLAGIQADIGDTFKLVVSGTTVTQANATLTECA